MTQHKQPNEIDITFALRAKGWHVTLHRRASKNDPYLVTITKLGEKFTTHGWTIYDALQNVWEEAGLGVWANLDRADRAALARLGATM